MSQQLTADQNLFPVRDDIDLDFMKANTFYATHRMHSFSAKFPPQLADWAISQFSQNGETVFDPMVGSGTTLVEAVLLGRNAIGCDIDPLARLMSKVKSTPIDPLLLFSQVASFEVRLRKTFEQLERSRANGGVDKFLLTNGAVIPDFPNRDYWFFPEVQEELALLVAAIGNEKDQDFVDFLYVVFSSTIITKGKTSVANVMDLAHSRPHYREPEEKPNTLDLFNKKLKKLADDLAGFSSTVWGNGVHSRIVGDDARHVPIPTNSVDFVFTSPPYVNAIDYPRAHKFSIFWLPEFLGIDADEYSGLGKEYVGTDRVAKVECEERMEREFALPLVDSVINELAQEDIKRAGVAHRYFENMQMIIAEMCRVLSPGRSAGIVVAPSNIKGVYVPTHQMLAEIGTQTIISIDERSYSFELEGIYSRIIDDSKRQLPYIRGESGPGMREEFVIILQKKEND